MTKEVAAMPDNESIESFSEKAKTRLAELSELVEMDFMLVGDQYPIDQIFDQENPDSFHRLAKEKQDEFLEAVGALLGIDLLKIDDKEFLYEFIEAGTPWQPSERGGWGKAYSLPKESEYGFFEVRVVDYQSPEMGRRYSLVRRETS
jgi:hypothetical protein